MVYWDDTLEPQFIFSILCGGGGGRGGGDDENDPICTDIDADGYYVESGCGTTVDCNDNGVNVNPGEIETCNSVYDDCDVGTPDDDLDEEEHLADVDCDESDASSYPGERKRKKRLELVQH